MTSWSVAGAGLAVAVALAPWTRASAEIRPAASAELLAGGGHDTNLFLQVAASPDSATWHATEGPWFWRLAPVVSGVLSGERLRLKIEYGADLRGAEGSGVMIVQEGTATVTLLEIGRIAASLGYRAGRYDNSRFEEDRFSWSAGEAGLGARLGATLRAAVRYRLDRRSFGAPAAVGVSADWAHFAEARCDVGPFGALSFGGALDYQTLRSTPLDGTATAGRLDRGHVGVDARFTALGPFTLFGMLWAGLQSYPGLSADRRLGGSVLVHYRINGALGALARYDAQLTRAGDPESTSYSRRVALVGLQLHVSTVRPGRVPHTSQGDEAPVVRGERVLFRVRFRGASSASVIGSWNDWAQNEAEQQLTRTRDPDLWERWVSIGAGRHRYHFLVDGNAIRPRDAPQYRSDGLGGEDGVVEVQ
jgi:hypothetical protein